MALDTAQEREAKRFRAKAVELLNDSDWLEDGVRHWLAKELQRPLGYVYSEREHAALRRIAAASTFFAEWGGYDVPELITAASKYAADSDEEDELFLQKLEASQPIQLRLREMGRLVALSRFAGVDLPRFKPAIELYDETKYDS
jgi:hypothetical protein